ncbi:MAB_1171c family putative transporter [Kitasatospora cineracea]|uniref:MAB_1171c family putative transporter n=1 Tax=Kitasatospora cineracea TaxID=88074 RepID=UPI0034260FA4
MRPLFTWLMPVLAWSIVLWRAPSAFSTPARRALWGVFVALAVGITVRFPAVDRALADLSGVRDVTQLVKHLAGVAAAYFLLEYIQDVRGRAERPGAARDRLLLAVAAAVLLGLLFFLVLPHDYDGAFGIDAHYGETGVRVYLGVFYAVLAVVALRAVALFWANRQSVEGRALRAGVTCLAAASGTGAVYVLYRILFVLRSGNATRLDAAGKPVPITDTASELLPAVAIVLLVLGVSLPRAWALADYLRDQNALRRLHPLWWDVAAVVPQVVLGTPRGPLRDLLKAGDRSLDLTHRVFAVRDAILILREDTADDDPAPADGGPVGPADGEERARAEARWLRSALENRAAGRPAPAASGLPVGSGGRTPHEEIAWMLRVADAYRSPGRTVPVRRAAVPAAADDR